MTYNSTLQNLDLSARPPMRLVVWGTATLAEVWPAETTEAIRADGQVSELPTSRDEAVRLAS